MHSYPKKMKLIVNINQLIQYIFDSLNFPMTTSVNDFDGLLVLSEVIGVEEVSKVGMGAIWLNRVIGFAVMSLILGSDRLRVLDSVLTSIGGCRCLHIYEKRFTTLQKYIDYSQVNLQI